MKIEETALLDFLGQEGARFEIPRYQRAYSWEATQCEELWRDLMRAARASRSHFAGALIYVGVQNAANPTLSIVDGQQRLTTASRATHARMSNLSTIEADTAAFKAQKDQPGGKKTFYQYIFNLEYDKLRG